MNRLTSDPNNVPMLRQSDYKYFLNKSIILYGPTGSGKTTLIDEILFNLKDKIGRVAAFIKDDPDGDFKRRIPEIFINDKITTGRLQSIYAEQQKIKIIYDAVNSNLNYLFDKLGTRSELAKSKIQKIRGLYESKKFALEQISNESERKPMLQTLKEITDSRIKDIKKQAIADNIRYIRDRQDLTQQQKRLADMVLINPFLLIVIDDFAPFFRNLKKEDPIMASNMFFTWRHDYITILISFQHSKNLDNEFRANAHISAFTEREMLDYFFSSKSSGFNKEKRKKVEQIGERIFDAEGKALHRKLFYFRGKEPEFKYTIADYANLKKSNFRLLDDKVWKYSKSVMDKKEKLKNEKLNSILGL